MLKTKPLKKIDRLSRIDKLVSMEYQTLLFLWLGSTALFAAIYTGLSYVSGQGPEVLEGLSLLKRFSEALYFSVITGTTVGYGDIVPAGVSKFFAALQSMFSFVILAMFVAKVASRKQEVALERIHRLSFNSAFQDIREGLFVARKDIDVVLKKIHIGGVVVPKDWVNIRTALRQMQIFIKMIPNFYVASSDLLAIDLDHERLLFDAVERSLGRVCDLQCTLEEIGQPLIGHADALNELYDLLKLARKVFYIESVSAYHVSNLEAFEEIITRLGEIDARL